MAAAPEIVSYIVDAANKRGIDPNVALEVARREALNVFDPNKPDLGGDERSSFGIYQLHYGGLSKNMPNPGVGEEFTAATGLHASDPSTWRQQVDFALDYAKKNGWGAWMGAKAAGITGKMGIDGRPANYTASAVSAAPPNPAAAAAFEKFNATHPQFPASTVLDDPPLLVDLPDRQPVSLLADDLAANTNPRVSGRGDQGDVIDLEGDDGTPLPEFASANPETPPSAQPAPAPTADLEESLADLFTLRDIGQAGETDPMTGQPKLLRTRRMSG
jgi:hypothetical protein